MRTERGDPVGYTDVWSVAPGDMLSCMVSTSSPTYEASLARLFGISPSLHTPISSVIDGSYPGRIQVARSGSWAVVEAAKAVASLESLTVVLWAWPTRPYQGQEQILITGAAWTLLLDERGRFCFRLESEAGKAEVTIAQPAAARTWTFVSASYDAIRGAVTVACQELGPHGVRQCEESLATPSPLRAGSRTIMMAAMGTDTDARIPWGETHFNGKLEDPTIYDRALKTEEIDQLAVGYRDEILSVPGLRAAWRFEYGMDGDAIRDVGPFAMHGRLVNAPTRAVTGHRWRGREHDPRVVPDEYAAIHFHDDDLEDAAWQADVRLRVPDNLRSGVYAIKLLSPSGGQDTVPFIVRPPRGTRTADIALVLPTLTYLAYANERLPGEESYAAYRFEDGLDVSPWDAWLAAHPELGLSLYDSHADGSGSTYSSRLRPIPSLRPDYLSSQLWFPRHLSADLLIVEWLHRIGMDVDLLTDEDVHRDGVDLLDGYQVVMTGSHPEYVTERLLDALEGYVSGGGHLMYLGGNGFFWVTSLKEPGFHLIEVRRGQTNQLPWDSAPGELHHSTTGELGGLWELRGRPARKLVGVGFAAMGLKAMPYVRTDAGRDPRYAWVFRGLGDDDRIGGGGDVLGNPAGYEVDRWDVSLGSSPKAVVLARAVGEDADYELFSPGSHYAKPPTGERPLACADMVLQELPRGGAVFSVGSVAWVGSLNIDDGDNPVPTVTTNVLMRFLGGPSSARQDST